MLGNRLSSLVYPIHVVWVKMWFSLKTYLLESCLGNYVCITITIYHQFIIHHLMGNICVEHTRPTSILISNSCVSIPNYTQLDARNPNIIIRISCTTSCFMNYYFDLIIIDFLD